MSKAAVDELSQFNKFAVYKLFAIGYNPGTVLEVCMPPQCLDTCIAFVVPAMQVQFVTTNTH